MEILVLFVVATLSLALAVAGAAAVLWSVLSLMGVLRSPHPVATQGDGDQFRVDAGAVSLPA